MIIDKADYAVFSDKRPLTGLRIVSSNGPDNGDDFDGGMAAAPVERPVEGMFNLDPLERYRYMFEQGQQVKLSSISADPQQTIDRANQVINQAIMPPVGDNPDRTILQRAIQLKRQAESRLDIAA